MPAVVACPKCKKKYQLPDKMLGKGVKCTQCQAQFKAAPAAQAQQPNRAAEKARAARAQQAQALKSMGVDGTIERPMDVFAGAGAAPGKTDPLGNHVIQDPGFGEGADIAIAPKPVEKPDDPMASIFSNPALAQSAKKKKVGSGKKKNKSGSLLTNPAQLIWMVFLPLFLLSLVFSWTELIPANTNWIYTLVIYGLLALVSTAVGIWGLVMVYMVSESVVQLLLCIFIPFYMLYFLYVNWEAMKEYGNALAATIGTGFVAGFALSSSLALVAQNAG